MVGDLRVNNQQKHQDETDIGDVADFLPNFVNRVVFGGVGLQRVDDQETFDDVEYAVHPVGDKLRSRADEPADVNFTVVAVVIAVCFWCVGDRYFG